METLIKLYTPFDFTPLISREFHHNHFIRQSHESGTHFHFGGNFPAIIILHFKRSKSEDVNYFHTTKD